MKIIKSYLVFGKSVDKYNKGYLTLDFDVKEVYLWQELQIIVFYFRICPG